MADGAPGIFSRIAVRLGVENGQRHEVTRTDRLDCGTQNGGHHVDRTALKRGQRRAIAIVGHEGHIKLALDGLHHRGHDRGQTTRTGRAEAHFARVLCNIGHHARIVREGRAGAGHQHRRAAGQEVDRDELAVVAFAQAHDAIEHRVFCTHKQRVAIRILIGDVVKRDRTNGTGHVLHDHRATEDFFCMRRDRAHDGIGRSAGAPLNDALNFTRRIILRRCDTDTENKRRCGAKNDVFHDGPPIFPATPAGSHRQGAPAEE